MIQDKLKPSPIEQNKQQQDEFQVSKRKLIRKQIPQALKKKLKTQQASGQQWKPQKLSEIVPKPTSKQTITSKTNSFLSSLPKPQHIQLSKPITNFSKTKPKPKPAIDMSNPTEQQLKYDIEDTTFIVKQFVDQARKADKQIKQEPENLVAVPQQYEGQDIKDISKGELIDQNWQQKLKQKQMKLSVVEELKNTLGQDNHINFLLDQAMRKNQQDQFSKTKKAQDFKKMKNRYGW